VIVLVLVTAKLIVLSPGVWSTWVMTHRKSPERPEPVPVSPGLLTVKVDSSARSSRRSTLSRRRAWGRRAGANRDSDRVVADHQRTLGFEARH
jgi:hypothetical protein